MGENSRAQQSGPKNNRKKQPKDGQKQVSNKENNNARIRKENANTNDANTMKKKIVKPPLKKKQPRNMEAATVNEPIKHSIAKKVPNNKKHSNDNPAVSEDKKASKKPILISSEMQP